MRGGGVSMEGAEEMGVQKLIRAKKNAVYDDAASVGSELLDACKKGDIDKVPALLVNGVLRVAGFWYCVPVTGQPKPVQSEPTLITPPRITPLLIMPPVGTRL
ncbi:unnamed protein product [Phytophthora lilii]|uniref:Unnamed protein product n=1 Tax=Phytophthora lilii TaxID=2077276 RepID=A0A9W6XNL1_9STRA|nr:unnamed protein product [Phytophthora lilii]